MESKNIDQATRQLIDALKQTCGAFGLGNDGNEYKIIVQVFLYKYFNDKFGYEAKRTPIYGERLTAAEKWDEEYDKERVEYKATGSGYEYTVRSNDKTYASPRFSKRLVLYWISGIAAVFIYIA